MCEKEVGMDRMRGARKTDAVRCESRAEELIRAEFYKDAQELLARSVRGGLVGFFLEEGLPVHLISDLLLEELGFTFEQYMADSGGLLLSGIHPDDQADYYAEVMDFVKNGGLFSRISRVRKGSGEFHWMRDVGKTVRLEDGRIIGLIFRSDFSDILEYQQELERKAAIYEEKSHQMDTLTANIPGGICEVSMDDNFSLVYGNDGFFNLYGYTSEQMQEERRNYILDLIYRKDQEHVQKIISDAYEQGQKELEFEHRGVKRDGSIAWMLVRGNISKINNQSLFSCAVLDITDRKKTEDEARMSERRFHIALAQTDSTIFEYDIQSKVMIHSERSAEYYGLRQRTENVPYSLLEAGVVHQDSADVFLQMYNEIRNGAPNASATVQTKNTEGVFEWRKITMTNVFDEEGEPIQAVGFLENIDQQVRREESLRYQSERDTLTDLYNRGALVNKVGDAVAFTQQGQCNAFFIIDIDAFKSVNDQYGHLFGDYVLSEGAKRIRSVCPKWGLIGRIGGDEFAAFVGGFESEQMVEACAQQIVEVFHGEFADRGITCKISCSVGIAVSDSKHVTFEELYQDADKALYEAKRGGKNKAVMYR